MEKYNTTLKIKLRKLKDSSQLSDSSLQGFVNEGNKNEMSTVAESSHLSFKGTMDFEQCSPAKKDIGINTSCSDSDDPWPQDSEDLQIDIED